MTATTTGLGLVIPMITDDMSTLDAALAYAADGFYIGPERRRTKDPGSILGKGWELQTSRDPQVISSWYAGTNHGIALHMGRSGAIAFDVDNPDKLHPAIKQAIDQHYPPYQSTRLNHPGRGHYLFKMPDGRRLGNGLGDLGGGWGEIRGLNGVIIVQPSEHEDPEGRYQWLQTGPLPVLPGYVATRLPDAEDAAEAATDAEVAAFLADHHDAERPGLLGIQLAVWQRKVAAGESRHSSVMGHIAGTMKEAAAGLVDAKLAADTFEAMFLPAVMQQPIGPKQGKARSLAEARSEWQGILAWAVAQGRAADPAETRARVEREVPSNPLAGPHSGPPPSANGSTHNDDSSNQSDPKAALAALLADLRNWQDLPDPVHVIATLAAAATRKAEGEACWLLLVAPPSSGKTEAVRLLDNTADARLDEITAAGLLSWTKGRNPRPTGVLTRVPRNALITFGDLSSLLATSDRGGRDQVFALLRRAYDGHAFRDVASPNGDRLEWSGRLTVVACVTGIIDHYAAHADQLGPRWIYMRIPARSIKTKRNAAQQARRGGLQEHRKGARHAVAALLASLPDQLPGLPDAVWDAIDDAALVTAWGRGAVPRNGYGRREIEGIPVVEEPMRLVQQLGALARGILAIGLPEDAAAAIVRRVALDSMPEARRVALDALVIHGVTNTSAVARWAGLDRKVARMTLEDLAAIGVVSNDRRDDDDDERSAVNWWLVGEAAGIITGVFGTFRKQGWGWDEM